MKHNLIMAGLMVLGAAVLIGYTNMGVVSIDGTPQKRVSVVCDYDIYFSSCSNDTNDFSCGTISYGRTSVISKVIYGYAYEDALYNCAAYVSSQVYTYCGQPTKYVPGAQGNYFLGEYGPSVGPKIFNLFNSTQDKSLYPVYFKNSARGCFSPYQ